METLPQPEVETEIEIEVEEEDVVAVTWLAPRKWLEIDSCAMMHIKCQVPKVVDNNTSEE